VAAFKGRVSCDVVSKSEIAVAVIVSGGVAAVLDIDSTEIFGMDEMDQTELEQIALFVASRL
jgi:putative methionine-R-sulfoxide reductase with GAF domain